MTVISWLGTHPACFFAGLWACSVGSVMATAWLLCRIDNSYEHKPPASADIPEARRGGARSRHMLGSARETAGGESRAACPTRPGTNPALGAAKARNDACAAALAAVSCTCRKRGTGYYPLESRTSWDSPVESMCVWRKHMAEVTG